MTRAARYDLVIIGGGIAGTMTAVLARRRHPELDLLVVDRSVPGLGATAYSACLDLPFGHTDAIRALTARSQALHRELRAAIPALPIVDLPLVGVCAAGGLDLARARLTEPAPRLRDPRRGGGAGPAIDAAPDGFAVPADHAVLDGLRATRWTGPVLDALVAALAAPAGAARADVLEGAEVVRIAASAGRYRLDVHDGRTIDAARVALCVGPWLGGALAALTGQRAEVRTKKVVSLIVPGQPAPGAPVIYLFEHEAFLLPQRERRRWLFSFRSEEWDVAPAPGALRLTADDLARATRILALHFPAGVAGPLGARVFCDAYTASRDPMIAAVPDHPGVAVIGGAGGSGVRLAPAMAERGLELLGL
jgi:glycine/D-amino acid oxidase-like deaminating enzyme